MNFLTSANPCSPLWPCTAFRLLKAVCVFLVLLFLNPAHGQENQALTAPEPGSQLSTAEATPLVTSIAQFWNTPPEQKIKGVDYDLICSVSFYDQVWKNLWVQDETGAAYAHIGSKTLPIQAGQRIRVTGTSAGSTDLSFEGVTISVLGKETLKPLPITDTIDDPDRYTNHFVSIDAIVDKQENFRVGRQHLFLAIEGRLAYAWLLFPPETPPPSYKDCRVRISGVYSGKRLPNGRLATLDILVSSPSQITILGSLKDDPRFRSKPTPIGELDRQPNDRVVLIRGKVLSQDPGHSLTLRDETGQITLISAQTTPCPVGSTVEAIGYPYISGISWKLNESVYRRSLSPETLQQEETVKTLRLAAQLSEISPEQAASGLPVFLSGVVTWSHPDSPFFFIQDSTGGACIYRGSDTSKLRPPGRSVEISGITALGDFGPVVTSSKVQVTGDLVIPEASSISLEHAMGGSSEAQWVEMRGFLREIHREAQWTRLEIATAAGDFNALIPATAYVPELKGSVIRVHGVCNAETNTRRQIKGIRLWVPGPENIQIEQEAPQDLFSTPSRSLASIGQFGAPIAANRRVKLSGIVLQHTPGHSFYLYDQGDSLLVHSLSTLIFNPGDQVDAVGFLSRQGNRVVLREATCRKTGTSLAPEPVELLSKNTADENQDGHLVSLGATLAQSTNLGTQTRLILSHSDTFFEAIIASDELKTLSEPLKPSSKLQLTGVYEIKFNELGKPAGFQLLLRKAEDIRILASPSWLTRERIAALAGALLLGIFLFITWVFSLRRRVNLQTELIRTQVQRESQLQGELQRASKLESLGLLAGGIAHDFNNLLTIIMGNLSLSSSEEGLSEETRESLSDATNAVVRARDLTQQLLTFAKGGAPIRSAIVLSDIVREVALFSTRGSPIACHFVVPNQLPPANVDKGQISQVVQNIVINAVQAMGEQGQLTISLQEEKIINQFGPILPSGQYIHLSIQDTGPGISPENLQKIFDPYFTTKKTGVGIGLATVHSIIRKHLGHISVESQLGKGTCFNIWLPVASPEAVAEQHNPSASLPALKGHVLLMDDEVQVLRLASTMLKRMGVTCTAVSDGAAALKAYTAARDQGTPYDLLILDLTVPGGMGGIQAMEQLLKLDPKVKAIVSSGYSNDLSFANYEECGFIDVVPKPYEMNDLARALQKHLS